MLLFGSKTPLASVVVAAIALVLGLLVGVKEPATRATTGLVSGLRFSSLGLIIIGTQRGGNPDYLGPALVFALVDMVVCLFVAVEMGRNPPVADPGPEGAS